jgi:hypothetical protein
VTHATRLRRGQPSTAGARTDVRNERQLLGDRRREDAREWTADLVHRREHMSLVGRRLRRHRRNAVHAPQLLEKVDALRAPLGRGLTDVSTPCGEVLVRCLSRKLLILLWAQPGRRRSLCLLNCRRVGALRRPERAAAARFHAAPDAARRNGVTVHRSHDPRQHACDGADHCARRLHRPRHVAAQGVVLSSPEGR